MERVPVAPTGLPGSCLPDRSLKGPLEVPEALSQSLSSVDTEMSPGDTLGGS